MKVVIIAGILILIGFLVVLSTIPIGIEPLTEVYFENHTKLPSYIFLNQKYNYSFTVRNLEYTDMQYQYEISFNDGNSSLILENGKIDLQHNQSSTFTKGFGINDNFGRGKLTVEIIKPSGESIPIHFWVEEIVPVKITKVNETE